MDATQLAGTFVGGIKTSSRDFPILVRLTGSGSGRPRLDQTGAPKENGDGRPTYTVDGQLIVLNRDGEIQINKGASIHTVHPLEAEVDVLGAAQVYRGEGTVFVTPYESSGRIAYSINVERLILVTPQTPQERGDK